MLRFVPARRRLVLEIGCGTAGFISCLTGCEEKWGIEPTTAGLIAKQELTHLLSGSFDAVKAQLPKNYFDLVICNDVIEHMVDHRAFLTEIREYIAPDGVLIGSIPNVRFYDNLFRMLFEKDWRYVDAGILDRTHLAFFTEKSLRQTLEETGYRVLRLSGINWNHLVDKTPKSYRYLRLAQLISKLSLGYFSDIRCVQFGFQAQPIR
jgi:SAM-dependent methyltransferase